MCSCGGKVSVGVCCFGIGFVQCLCGGDEIECAGCVDCEPTVVVENDLFCHEDHSHAASLPPEKRGSSGARARRANSHT